MDLVVVVLEVVFGFESINSLFVNLGWVRVSLEAKSERSATIVRLSGYEANIGSFFSEGILQSLDSVVVNSRVVSHGHNRLSDDNSIVAHDSVTVVVEISSEKYFSTAIRNRVSRVNNDNIKAFISCLHNIIDSISDNEFHSGVLESSSTERRHVFFTLLNNNSINVNHDKLFKRLMSHALTGSTTISSSNNKDSLGVRVNHHRHVANHFVINEFISSGDVQNIIEVKAGTPPFVLTDNNLLEVRLGVNKKRSLSDQSNDLVSVKFSL